MIFYNTCTSSIMYDFSIENNAEKIVSPKTREYFREVISSYYNGNHRAAIVTLYSVVIVDIIIKLETLRDVYSDESAAKILDDIKNTQNKTSPKSAWETQLIEVVSTKTQLFDNIDKVRIDNLTKDRHLCAHPVIDKEDKLHTPNRETVASHIRNMMESLFLKPALLSKKVLPTILTDLEEKTELLIDDHSLKNYLESKYLKSLTQPVELAIFKELWGFVFKKINDECNKNRDMNFRFLNILFQRNSKKCTYLIREEKDRFSNNVLNNKETIYYLTAFLAQYDFLYNELNENVKLAIRKNCSDSLKSKILAWFLSDGFQIHLDDVRKVLKEKHILVLLLDDCYKACTTLITIGVSRGYEEEVISFIISLYVSSQNYDKADLYFDDFVRKHLEYFSEHDFISLCEGANQNSQTYDRRNSPSDHKYLMDFIRNKHSTFDFTPYPNLFKDIQKL